MKNGLRITVRIVALFLLSLIIVSILSRLTFVNDIIRYTGNLVMVLPVFILYIIFGDRKKYSLNLKDKIFTNNFIFGASLGIASMTIIFFLNLMLNRVDFLGFNNVFNKKDFYLYLLTMIGVAIGEEVFSRGYLQSMVTYFSNKNLGIIIPAIIFALLHFLNDAALDTIFPTINLILVSIVFALMTRYSKSIWMAVGYHLTWNFFQGAIFGFNVSGINFSTSLIKTNVINKDLIYGGDFGPEGGILVSILLLVTIILIRYIYHKNKKMCKENQPES